MRTRHKAAQWDLPLPGETFSLVGERVKEAEALMVVHNADVEIEQARLRLEVRQAVEDIKEGTK